MTFLGIDLHSNCFTCCFLNEDGSKIKWNYNLTSTDLERFFKLLNKDTYVIIEASTNTFSFAQLITEKVNRVVIANTHKLKLISMTKKKTDKIDAEKLAVLLKMQILSNEELIQPVYVPKKTIQNLRSLFTTYRLIRKQIGSIKNRIHSLLKQNLFPFTKEFIFGKKSRKMIMNLPLDKVSHFQISYLMEELEHLEKRIEAITQMILETGAEYQKEIDILTSMRGISVITAIAIIADIETVKRFPNSKHFASYLRSAPSIDSSNTETRIKSTNKFARKLSIVMLSQSLNHFRDSNKALNKWYDKKVNIQQHKKGKIRMALCRKIFTEIYQMLKKEEYHYYRDSTNHEKKMKEYRIFLQQRDILKNGA